MRKVLIAYNNISPHDAVGYDAIEEARLLQAAGWEVCLCADSVHPELRSLTRTDVRAVAADKAALLIYHHAVFWERGLHLLESAKCKRVLRYHNITPAHFFSRYSADAYKNSFLARDQNRRMAAMGLERVICDSNYNAREFAGYGVREDHLRVAAPFNRIEQLQRVRPSQRIVDQLRNDTVKVLFVGRVSPNKGHTDILHTAQAYKVLFGDNVHFIIAGGMDSALAGYYRDLRQLADRLRVSDLIEYVGQVPDEELAAYFAGSDVFLLLSEHEGFCLPILEAQAFGLPLLARDCAAIGETAGANQLVYEREIGFEILAGAIKTLHERKEMSLYLSAQGRINLERFSRDKLNREFSDCIEDLA